MAKNIEAIASCLGAKVIGQVSDVGAGAFGAARLARIIETTHGRLVSGEGRRPGRPTDPNRARHSKTPKSD